MLPTATFLDAARAVRDVLLPVVAQGAILRRPAVSRVAELLHADDRALRRVRALRQRYGEGPLLIRIPGRTVALVMDPDHVHRILHETPEPFSAATSDKVGALNHFQPHGVLATDPPLRAPRRALNEEALDTARPVHRSADQMVAAITQELHPSGTLDWTDFRKSWSRMVRRIVLGDSARDDSELTRLLDVLRANANWAAIHPVNRRARERFDEEVGEYVENAAPGSLVEALMHSTIMRDSRTVEPGGGLDPAGQVPHWLFAFDAAGIALWRLLAVLATRPDVAKTIAEEESPLRAYAGAAAQESVRLWPTTLVVLREGRAETRWDAGTAPAGTEFAIVSSVFHRDDEALEFANDFVPEIWLDGRSDGPWPLLPFSEGPAVCPGRNVVLLTIGTAAHHLTSHYDLDLDPHTRARLTAGPLPATFDHTAPRMGFWRK
ncbi:cytochrome P450 [Kribbella turkmenica]|uniref:Cytochrome P450 n=1 Tax=Kribbella turkmenica TaxID=2530375 RepID=A0A4R4WLX0_9ACTN|nr:cytochrome P450 [Kribbella turkmenica]TDD20159.1 cytochrome P450 [Kribbella turkmenica]